MRRWKPLYTIGILLFAVVLFIGAFLTFLGVTKKSGEGDEEDRFWQGFLDDFDWDRFPWETFPFDSVEDFPWEQLPWEDMPGDFDWNNFPWDNLPETFPWEHLPWTDPPADFPWDKVPWEEIPWDGIDWENLPEEFPWNDLDWSTLPEDFPWEDVPWGDAPADFPWEDLPWESAPWGSLPEEFPWDKVPWEDLPADTFPADAFPWEHIPWEELPEDFDWSKVPWENAPWGDLPADFPWDKVPWGDLPADFPWTQVPWEKVPEDFAWENFPWESLPADFPWWLLPWLAISPSVVPDGVFPEGFYPQQWEHEHQYAFEEWELIDPPSCGVAGLERNLCTVCGRYIERPIPATGRHVFEEESGVCTVCGVRRLYLASESKTAQYSGSPLVGDAPLVIAEGSAALAEGHRINDEAVIYTQWSELGKTANIFRFAGGKAVVDEEGNDVTSQYYIIRLCGTLELTKREVTLYTPNKTKKEDGTPLNGDEGRGEEDCWVEGLVEGDYLTDVVFDEGQTARGRRPNAVISFRIVREVDGKIVDVTDNYAVKTNFGTLRVTG